MQLILEVKKLWVAKNEDKAGHPTPNRDSWRIIKFSLHDTNFTHFQGLEDGAAAWRKLELIHLTTGMTSILRNLRDLFTMEKTLPMEEQI